MYVYIIQNYLYLYFDNCIILYLQHRYLSCQKDREQIQPLQTH